MLVPSQEPDLCSARDFATRLHSAMRNLQPVQPRSSPKKIFVSQDLDTCTHVFVRVDAVQHPLSQPYQGPYRVLRRTRKTVTIDRNGTQDAVSMDRVKPAYLLDPAQPQVVATTSLDGPDSSSRTRKISFLLPRN
ncbi:uncharacterized protein LOC123519720 [Portunus trituberculatus]|uniref:uncharacterized protein LOC123519720 n=1 Tax=Portunus trituberculatus TaxID=210409 RepID=UPI001E1CC508|nr:uncharacterized protein LOC123519720 [Portunus trituberculatus]